MEFVFSEVKSGECILIPGDVVVMEDLEEMGILPQYMDSHIEWIKNAFARSSLRF
jgi:hypothetical protein